MEYNQGLPVLPQGISSLLKTLNKTDIGYTQLAVELESFPSIVIKIVATANSSWSYPVDPITTLRDSCARIGFQAVRSLSTALSIAEVFDPSRCKPFDSKIFWMSALITAEAAYICAKDDKNICPDTARLAGLLNNIGLLWLASQKPEEIGDILFQKKSGEIESLNATMDEVHGVNIYTAGSCLANHIDLPSAITQAISSPANNNDDSDLSINHRRAIQLSSAVLCSANPACESSDVYDNDPNFEALSKKFEYIESLAQALFM